MKGASKGVIAGAVMASIILFVGMILFVCSFSVVEPNYMAIARSKITSHIEENKVYFEGRHFLGVGYEFIHYPMAWQLIEYTDDESIGKTDFIAVVDVPLDAGTSEGHPMSVEVSLYFTIPPQQLINFYKTYNLKYQDSIANECKRVLKETLSQFKYDEIFMGRLMISEAMTTALTRSLAHRRCKLEKLLLRGIYFRSNIEDGIESNVMGYQDSTNSIYKNEVTMIEAEIDSLKKKNAFEINIKLSEAQKEASVIIQEAKAYAASTYANSTAYAWKNYQTITDLDSDNLLRVQWARTLGSTSAKDSVTVGYDTVGSHFVQKVTNA